MYADENDRFGDRMSIHARRLLDTILEAGVHLTIGKHQGDQCFFCGRRQYLHDFQV
jgi:hypothetical protein